MSNCLPEQKKICSLTFPKKKYIIIRRKWSKWPEVDRSGRKWTTKCTPNVDMIHICKDDVSTLLKIVKLICDLLTKLSSRFSRVVQYAYMHVYAYGCAYVYTCSYVYAFACACAGGAAAASGVAAACASARGHARVHACARARARHASVLTLGARHAITAA